MRLNTLVDKSVKVLASQYFLYGIIVLFIAQAGWVALSFRYPMIYDEYFHFGLIEYFSHQISPWIFNQPERLDLYSSLAREPYLLYHYLLSFPYRFLDLFTDNFAVQVISLRFINIILYATGLYVFWLVFRELKVKPVFRNVALLFFSLLPVSVHVAAHVNYDNAIILLTAVFMLICAKSIKSPRLLWQHYALLTLVGMSGSLMKPSFIPIFASGFIFVTVYVIRAYGKAGIVELASSYKKTAAWSRVLIIVPLVLVGVLFIERFGINVIQHHTLDPKCEASLSEERCSSNPINAREDILKESTGSRVPIQQPEYVALWANETIRTLLITGSNTSGIGGTKYGAPLPLPYMVVFWGAVAALMLTSLALYENRKQISNVAIVLIVAAYLVALLYINYSTYMRYYTPIGIQGRYILPILPVLIVFALTGVNYLFGKYRTLKLAALLSVFILYLNGAGVVTHVVRSTDAWYWDNTIVRSANKQVREVISPVVKEKWY